MKQHIEIEQLEELSKEQKIKLCEMTNDTGIVSTYKLKLQGISTSTFPNIEAEVCNRLNIGKMIEIIKDVTGSIGIFTESNGELFICHGNIDVEVEPISYKELCDALWESIKEILK